MTQASNKQPANKGLATSQNQIPSPMLSSHHGSLVFLADEFNVGINNKTIRQHQIHYSIKPSPRKKLFKNTID
jgi:hypothetical protein